MTDHEKRNTALPEEHDLHEAQETLEGESIEKAETEDLQAQDTAENKNPAEKGFEKKSWKEIAAERREQLKSVTDRLEAGVRDYMANDDQFKKVLETMAKFHHYSARNILLITMQMPSATHVASYGNWQKKFNRQVKRGQKGMSIIVPAPYKKKTEREMTDPRTGKAVLDADGSPKMEEVEITVPRFKVAKVFDVSQTAGEPLPELNVPELEGKAENYKIFMDALHEISPAPIRFDEVKGTAKGYYDSHAKEIVIQNNMSESQTMKTAVHEVAHARLHDRDRMAAQGIMKDQQTRETEAEAIAFTVLSYYKLDTSDYSIPYLASWSGGMDTKALQASMDTIRITASQIIDEVDAYMDERLKERMTELFTVYQLNDTEDTRPYHFESIESLKKEGLEILPGNYHEVYQGKLEQEETLEDLYIRFNQDKLPEGYEGHSLSVSDIVVLDRDGEEQAWYVDRFGYTEVPEFLNTLPDHDKERETATETHPEKAAEQQMDSSDQKKPVMMFFVAECMDFPVMGEYHEGLSLAQAAELYEKMAENKMHGGKGIGCVLQNGDDSAEKYVLVSEGSIRDDAASKITDQSIHEAVQSAVDEMKTYFSGISPAGERSNATTQQDQSRSDVASEKAAAVVQQGPPARPGISEKTDSHAVSTEGSRPKKDPAGRKESVLEALREHQKKARTENNRSHEKVNQQRKGELSL